DIRLKSQNLQIEHELRVVGKLRRDTYRSIEVAQLGICCRVLGTLDLTLDLTNTIEILIHAHAIGNSHALLEPRDVHAERVQQASAIAQPRAARGSIAAFAEQAFEDDARMRLGRKWSRRRRPREAILIHACVTVVAHTGEWIQVHRKLQRSELRLPAYLLGRDLVDRCARKIIRAVG